MDHYAVFGNPIHHSLSPIIHRLFAEQTQQDLTYTATLVPINGLAQALDTFQAHGGKGLNITLPFKQKAFQLLTQVTSRARQAQAVNTIMLNADGSRLGDNTDGAGFLHDVKHNLQIELQHKRILILGAGGAIRGMLAPLLAEQPSEVIIANRTLQTAETLVHQFCALGNLSASTLDLRAEPFDIIINGISAGLHGTMPELNKNIIHANTFCYDLVYANTLTPFLAWATQQGVTRYADGLGMLVEQAAEAFFLWRGIKPQTLTIIQQLRTTNECR
jgi:shikimate dehydrogenase